MKIKKLVGKLDRAILGGVLTRIYQSINTRNSVKHKAHQLNYSFDVHYQKNDSSLLNILADKYGSDKGEVSPD